LENIIIEIIDKGCGISMDGMKRIYSYTYSTASTPFLDPKFNQKEFKAPMAGFGYGIPLSRLV
jgi:pyruvate dehydrogenase kinase 2/3/4